MARPTGNLRVGRYFLALLGIFVVLYAVVFWPGQRHTPKLGIDLVGGIRVVFKAVGNTNGNQMDVARQIMENRVNSNGVTGATVQVQGGNEILILIPNGTGQDVKNLGAAAKLNFRPLVTAAVPVTCGTNAPAGTFSQSPSSSPSTTPSSTASPSATSSGTKAATSPAPSATKSAAVAADRPLAASATSTPTPTGTPTPSGTSGATAAPTTSTAPSAAASASQPRRAGSCTSTPFAGYTKAGGTVPLTDTAFNALGTAQQQQLQYGSLGSDGALSGGLTNFDCGSALTEPDVNDQYYVVCGDGYGTNAKQKYAFLLGKVVVPGSQISDASAQAPDTSGTGGSSEWTVRLELKDSGNSAWSAYTTAHNISALGSSAASSASAVSCSSSTVPCADFVAFTLNGEIISAPVNESPINGGATQITGGWGQDPTGAKELAQQLQFGSLPLTFVPESIEPVSATLGKSQLHAALLAGAIGLALVVLYSLLYYRGLGLVTIASLLVSAGLTYALLVILGTHMGFTLDLAGVTGFIVALGITADSFVVFFERIKDEVHDGRSARVAVPRAWVRARRTILSADIVSFLAAAILYFFASADVQGFAFTLGMSTVLDLVVVFLFTHPIVSLFSRSRAFGSARFTGLNSVRAGGVAVDTAPRAPRRTTEHTSGVATAVLAEPRTETVSEPGGEAPETAPVLPAPGATAAERAAARRARLKGEQPGTDGKGDS